MIYCESPTLEQWIPPPVEDFPRPTWTKLLAGGVELSNCVEDTDWLEDPVQPIACEGCWHFACTRVVASIAHIGDHLLWLPPGPRDIDQRLLERVTRDNFIRETVLIPATTWNQLRRTFPKIPPHQSFRRATRGDVAAVWLNEMPKEVRATELRCLAACLQQVLASDPLDQEPAMAVVQSMVDWVLQNPEQPVEGEIRSARESEGRLNTFYFDGPPFVDWPAFVVEQTNSFAFGGEWVFLNS